MFWRPQVALFVNECCLLPVLLPLAPAASVVQRFPAVFVHVAVGIGVDASRLDAEMAEQVLAKTASRRVVGVMNEFVHLAENHRWKDGSMGLVELALRLAQVPCSPLYASNVSPDRELQAVLS